MNYRIFVAMIFVAACSDAQDRSITSEPPSDMVFSDASPVSPPSPSNVGSGDAGSDIDSKSGSRLKIYYGDWRGDDGLRFITAVGIWDTKFDLQCMPDGKVCCPTGMAESCKAHPGDYVSMTTRTFHQ